MITQWHIMYVIECIVNMHVVRFTQYSYNFKRRFPVFKSEVEVWKTKCSCFSQEESEKIKLLDVLILADSDFFPNVHETIKLLLTLPVGSVPCERSFSIMRLLKNWNRSTMAENRLTGLALLMVHCDMDVSRENILARFDSVGLLGRSFS